MPSPQQRTGKIGVEIVRQNVNCPKCKRAKTLQELPQNFNCANLIFDFCGYLAQVITRKVMKVENIPEHIIDDTWGAQKERMDSGIYSKLFYVNVQKSSEKIYSIFYLPADLQFPSMFKPREPLASTAKRAGWQGFAYDGAAVAKVVTKFI